MPLPKSVKVGAHAYSIVADIHDEEDKHGQTLHVPQVIRVRPAQGASALRDTVLHEVLHAICGAAGSLYVMGVEGDDEERLIRFLTPWILGVLRDNPRLVAYLLEK